MLIIFKANTSNKEQIRQTNLKNIQNANTNINRLKEVKL